MPRKRTIVPYTAPAPFETTEHYNRAWCPDADERTNRLIAWFIRLAVCVPHNTCALDDPQWTPVRELAIEWLNKEFGTALRFDEDGDAVLMKRASREAAEESSEREPSPQVDQQKGSL